ncbi:hypothetical protein PROFUN_04437 [Planoprotostelium fungivorum]|uniref:F-box domain-containing protein n=1 Tax=Planoprotostelium fungivorum TaxID=1890364 RepID=A0A2P6NVM0_9EUKA|nr:hypothetical protein PROFUN_04437 [Planoprotostelium fungivorum]
MAMHVVSWLSPRDLSTASAVSQQWNILCNDHSVWDNACEDLWRDKLYVPPKIRELRITSPKDAYILSISDSKRNLCTDDELCHDAWEFHFKETMGPLSFTHNRPNMYLKFEKQGVVNMTPAERGNIGRPVTAIWRWVELPHNAADLPSIGKFLQVNRYPLCTITRRKDWGFKMQNDWVEFYYPPLKKTIKTEGTTTAPAVQ